MGKVLTDSISEYEIRTQSDCLDIRQHKIKFVPRNDQKCIVAWISVKSNWDLYRLTPKMLGKCLISNLFHTLHLKSLVLRRYTCF